MGQATAVRWGQRLWSIQMVTAFILLSRFNGFCQPQGSFLRWHRTKVHAEREPRELVDLFGMKTRELKAFLKKRGVQVDDCFDMDSLIQRAAATEEDWAGEPQRLEVEPVAAEDTSKRGNSDEVEKAWQRLCEAWPGSEPREFGPSTADKCVIFLHGFGDQNAQFLVDTLQPMLNIQGLRLILPQAPEETLQNQKLQSWFLPINGQWIIDDRVSQPISAYLHAMIRREIARGVAAHKIVVGGFAQGAGCALRAALSFPDAALGGSVALSGFFGDPSVSHLFALDWHSLGASYGGPRQSELVAVVPFSEGQRAATLLRQSLQTVTFKEFEMKHGIASDELFDVMDFVDKKMAQTSEEPLAFDPAKLTPSPPPQPPPSAPLADTPPSDKGVPTLDPQVTLELLNDPEIAKAATDPEGMAVIQDVMMDPANLRLHKDNPRVAKVVEKLEAIFSKAGDAK
eukprot:s2001_g15.t3